MTQITETDIHDLLKQQSITLPLKTLDLSTDLIRSEILKRKKKRFKIVTLSLVPAVMLVFGFGSVYENLGQQEIDTQHVLPAVTVQQLQQITHGSVELAQAYEVLIGWLQSQLSWNPSTWDSAPFKSYKVLDITQNDDTHATASIDILLQNNQWSGRDVPLNLADGKWTVGIAKYGEPSEPRYVTIPRGTN